MPFMRNCIILFSILCAVIPAAHAGQITLAWDPSSSPGVVGYKIYFGTAAGVYGAPITIGNQTTYTVSGLAEGTWYLTVTAFDAEGLESDFATAADDPTRHYVVATITATQPAVTLRIVPAEPPGPVFTVIMASQILTTEATITWGTWPECDGIALWGKDPAQLFAIKSNNLGTTDHLVRITGLTPRTHYVYKVESVCNGQKITSGLHSFNTK